ncbi:hypothetical protein RJ640_023584 [Escallonia rubra]|uniref:Uncharacterized protein n=1 Tax=Escallonia rubra TaxID=112253 RepID=A0AA88R130_9ASTE|nr:hypothetical protein RJ640_023584 [Escallonia rubra]
MDEGEKRFNQLSIEERGKFDEETLVNVNSIRKQSATSQRANGFSNEYIVITILVAAEGVNKLPAINDVDLSPPSLDYHNKRVSEFSIHALPTSSVTFLRRRLPAIPDDQFIHQYLVILFCQLQSLTPFPHFAT